MLLNVNVIKYHDQSEHRQMVKLREINMYHLIQELRGLTVMFSSLCTSPFGAEPTRSELINAHKPLYILKA